jgi:1-acyl-sn-glycerol-3-phosphate acyltransferase
VVVFGLGALVLTLTVFPVLRLWPGTEDARRTLVQGAVHGAFRLFLGYLSLFGALKICGTGLGRLMEGPRLIIANHPTLLDVVLLVSRMRRVDCVVKGALWKNPFLQGVVRAAGYISNEDGPASLDEVIARLKAGRSVVLFPEGTRSPVGGLGAFSRGFARAALESRREILPVFIRCDPPALSKGRLFTVPLRKVRFSLNVDAPIRPPETGEPTALAARKLAESVRRYYEEKLSHADDGNPGIGTQGPDRSEPRA